MTEGHSSPASAPAMRHVARMIDGIGDRGFCRAFSAAASAFLDFDNLVVIAYSGETRPVELYREHVSPVVFAQMTSSYLTAHYVFDPFYTAHLNRVPRGLYNLEDVAPDKFRQTAYFSDYYRATTLVDEVALFAYSATGWTITACFGRDHMSGKRFDRRQLAEFGQLADVFAAVMERHWRGFVPEARAETGTADDIAQTVAERLIKARGIELTPRQIQVGLRILQGHSSRSIALDLGVSWQTVKVFRKQLYARCGISSQAELFALLLPLIEQDVRVGD